MASADEALILKIIQFNQKGVPKEKDEENDENDEDEDDSWDDEDTRENVEDRIRALPLTAEATPQAVVTAIEEIIGRSITATERDHGWDAFQKLSDDD